MGFAFTGAVVGEFVASSRGLGYLLQFAQSTYNAGLTIALIVLILAFTLVLFALAERLEPRRPSRSVLRKTLRRLPRTSRPGTR